MAYISGSITEESKIIVLDSNHNKIVSKDFTPDSTGYTKLLLHFDEATLIDSSAAPKTLTLNGGVARSAAQSKFGGYAVYFDGINDSISLPHSSDLTFGSEPWTIDFWAYVATGGFIFFYDKRSVETQDKCIVLSIRADGTVGGNLSTNGSTWLYPNFNLASSFPFNQWNHVAITFNGTIYKAYINGIAGSTPLTAPAPWINTQPVLIGTYANISWGPGYIDEYRISKGIARWTTNFTPPTQAYKTPAPFMYNIGGSNRYAYNISNLTLASGTIIAMSNSGEVVGYNKMNFVPSLNLEATGGNITYFGNYKIHTFTSNGTFIISSNDYNKSIDSLVIAGGGGGGSTGAGAGAGGYVYTTSGTISANSYPVVVGTGGLGGATGGYGGAKGNNSTFNGTTAEGGGGGWSHGSTSAESGGCGAGGAIKTSGSATPGGIGRQGYNGGAGYINSGWYGGCGGGGGAGQAGEAGTYNSGKGGDGLANSITGTSITYAGGGGGGEVHGNAGSAFGGAGGGGRANSDNVGSNGTNGLGGGGGGGSYNGTYFKGGDGGSGIVIIRYLYQ